MVPVTAPGGAPRITADILGRLVTYRGERYRAVDFHSDLICLRLPVGDSWVAPSECVLPRALRAEAGSVGR